MTQKPATAVDFDSRVHAVNQFKALESASDLVAANKRVGNILNKNNVNISALPDINTSLFEETAETALFEALKAAQSDSERLIANLDYTELLSALSVLKTPLNAFFDDVMIMAEDEKVKANRVALVGKARQLFLSVADVSLLSV
jgi:glycyl-tRNA synthetase beta chain